MNGYKWIKKYSPWLEKILKISISEMAINALKVSTLFVENFENCFSEMATYALKNGHYGRRKFKNLYL